MDNNEYIIESSSLSDGKSLCIYIYKCVCVYGLIPIINHNTIFILHKCIVRSNIYLPFYSLLLQSYVIYVMLY